MTSTGAVRRLITISAFCLLALPISRVSSQSNQTDKSPSVVVSIIRPSVAIVIGIFSIVFALTLLLLMYARFCNTLSGDLSRLGIDDHHPDSSLHDRRFSGLDNSIIESLPSFKFSSLKGSKQGLECSVCLSTFEDSDVLRLLPKCKHMFHMECIGQWLESHSSCPLCRYKVELEDLTMFKYSNSSRFLFRDMSDRNDIDREFELFVEREINKEADSYSHGSSRQKKTHKDKESFILEEEGVHDRRLHKLEHKIKVSDSMLKNRWSDLNSSDLTSLNSDMLNAISTQRFSNLKRCMSDQTGSSSGIGCGDTTQDDNVRKLWLAIAKKTVTWFDGREKFSRQEKENMGS